VKVRPVTKGILDKAFDGAILTGEEILYLLEFTAPLLKPGWLWLPPIF
jgi:hypothetical protein